MARSVRSASALADADGGAEVAEPLGDGGHLGVGVVQPLERAPRRRRVATRCRSCAAVRANRACSPRRVASATPVAGLVDGRLDLDAGSARWLLPPRTKPGGEHVAVGGDGGDALAAGDERRGQGGVGDEGDPVEQLLDGGAHGRPAPRRPRGPRRPSPRGAGQVDGSLERGGLADEERGPAGVVGAQAW